MTFEAFVWGPHFLTGIPVIDGQHQRLVELINRLGEGLVDDEPDILNSLKRLLRRSGYRILTAGSAAEGLELLALNSVQVIVSDQRMPNMSGSEFLGRVKILYPDSMRIVLSGYTEVAALTDAINRGAIYKFVTKPWNDDDLRRVIREAFVAHAHKATKPATAKSTGEPA